MKTIQFIIILLVVITLSSCEKEFVTPTQNNTPTAIFQQTWNAIDQKYSFLEYKKINWDSIGSVYREQVSNTISDDSLFNVLGKMLFHLKDGHVNLRSNFNVSRNWEWFLGFPQNFDLGLLQRNYLADYKTTNNLIHKRIKDVGYVYYKSFAQPVSENDLDYILDTYKNTKGLIIDVRNNGGGDPVNIFAILNRLTATPTLVGRTYEKVGKSHNDFSESSEIWLTPNETSKKYLGKVILLTNRNCYSATSHFVAWARALPNVSVIGDSTGGGSGLPTSIQLSNGWILRYSSTIGVDAKGFNFENGTPPDLKMDMDKMDFDNGKDSILERALISF